MYCLSPVCKKQIDDDSLFCKFCGVRQIPAPPTSAPVAGGTGTQDRIAAMRKRAEEQQRKAREGVAAPAAVAPQAPVATEAAPVKPVAADGTPIHPRFDKAPEPPEVVFPTEPTPEKDFFLYAGTLKIYKGNHDVVVVPEGTTSIGSGVFRDHKNLREVYLPSTITSITSEAFAGCTALEKINLPEGLNSIGPKAFQDCASLKEIFIPRTVQRILDRAFEGCSSLKEVYLFDGVVTLNFFVFHNCSSLAKVRLPNRLVQIPEGFFKGCTSLTGVDLPEGLKNIERQAFANTGLEYIVLPFSLINVEEHAFSDIPSLQGITVPKITKLHNYTFVNTNLINKATIKYVMD